MHAFRLSYNPTTTACVCFYHKLKIPLILYTIGQFYCWVDLIPLSIDHRNVKFLTETFLIILDIRCLFKYFIPRCILQSMVMSFRVSELQELLNFAGYIKSGRKHDLMTRALYIIRSQCSKEV